MPKKILRLVLSVAAIVSLLAPTFTTSKIYASTRDHAVGTVELSGVDWLNGGGVNVYSNGSSAASTWGDNCVAVPSSAANGPCPANTVYSGYKWQCVELVNRLYIAKGWITSRWTGNGSEMYDTAPSSFAKELNGNINSIAPGDVVVYTDNGGPGHVAVVNGVANNSDGSKTISTVNQNTQDVFLSAKLTNKTLASALDGYSVKGVVHAPNSGGSTSNTHSNAVLRVRKQTASDGTQQVYTATSTDVYESWWNSTSNGVQINNLINISQQNIVDFDKIVTAEGVNELFTATTDGVWETNWSPSASGPSSSRIISGLSGVKKILARQETISGVTTTQLYVMTSSGVTQYWWNNGSNGIHSYQLSTDSNPVDMVFDGSTAGVDQLYVATAGAVKEYWWKTTTSGSGNGAIISISQNNITSIDKVTVSGVQYLATATSTGEWESKWGAGVSGIQQSYKVSNFSGTKAVKYRVDSSGNHDLYLANSSQVQHYTWTDTTSGGEAAISISQNNITSIDVSTNAGIKQLYTGAGTAVWETWWNNGVHTGNPALATLNY